ncbi:MAG: hypothetical protein ACK4L7_10625, partial [Flavobacteriales bacterium]
EPFAPMEWLGIPILSAQTPLTLLALLLVPLLAWVLLRTPLGLAVRMVGEKLRDHFPYRSDDRDELSNEVSIG